MLPATIAEHDAHVRDTLSLVRSTPSGTALILVLRGQYRDAAGRTRAYRSEDIRLLTYYLPDTTLIDFPGVKNHYITAREHRTTEASSTTIPFSDSVQELIILAEYLHPLDYPKGATRIIEKSNPHRYTAPLSGITSFQFNGFTFRQTP